MIQQQQEQQQNSTVVWASKRVLSYIGQKLDYIRRNAKNNDATEGSLTP